MTRKYKQRRSADAKILLDLIERFQVLCERKMKSGAPQDPRDLAADLLSSAKSALLKHDRAERAHERDSSRLFAGVRSLVDPSDPSDPSDPESAPSPKTELRSEPKPALENGIYGPPIDLRPENPPAVRGCGYSVNIDASKGRRFAPLPILPNILSKPRTLQRGARNSPTYTRLFDWEIRQDHEYAYRRDGDSIIEIFIRADTRTAFVQRRLAKKASAPHRRQTFGEAEAETWISCSIDDCDDDGSGARIAWSTMQALMGKCDTIALAKCAMHPQMRIPARYTLLAAIEFGLKWEPRGVSFPDSRDRSRDPLIFLCPKVALDAKCGIYETWTWRTVRALWEDMVEYGFAVETDDPKDDCSEFKSSRVLLARLGIARQE